MSDKKAVERVCRAQHKAVMGLAYNAAERICGGDFIIGSRSEESTAIMVLFGRLTHGSDTTGKGA